jgi:ribonuclease HI
MINIYTDGSCRDNSRDELGNACGEGGWAFIILNQEYGMDMEILTSDSGYKKGSTNQEMEIIAVAEALETICSYNFIGKKIILYSDSAYVINCIKDEWYINWESNGWLNSKGKSVKNRESWERVIKCLNRINLEFFHVNRNSTRFIKLVDGMAKEVSKRETNQESSER